MMTITDEQARIIGQEIGREFAVKFWTEIGLANPSRMTEMPSIYLLEKIGQAIGKELKNDKRSHLELRKWCDGVKNANR